MMRKWFSLFLAALALVWTAFAGAVSGEEAPAPERFLVISDAHLTKETQDHEAAMEAVILAARGKDAVLLLGDNTNNTHAEEHRLVLEWADEIRRRTGAAVYIIPGNHDYGARFGPEEFRAQYRAYGWAQAFSRDAASAGCAVMTAGGTCLLLLDTNKAADSYLAEANGGISEETLRWLQDVLEKLPDGTPVLACGHHPILRGERNERTPGADALSRLLQAYGVGLYVCGHDHGFAAARQDGLRQITVGRPQAYPGWAGSLERKGDGFFWAVESIYDPDSPVYLALRESAREMGRSMARGTLAETPYAGDEEAVEWFVSAYMLFAGGEMTPEKSAALLADENCCKWREIETRTVVKAWMLNLLENCPEDARRITVLSSRKHPAQAGE